MKKRKPPHYWTKERCQEEASKYKTRCEFKLNSMTAYNTSLKNKWINEVCQNMITIKKPSGYWTKERCVDEALKYNHKKDFAVNSMTAYNVSVKNNWIAEITQHMTKPKCYNQIWVRETCKKEALKYKSLIDFQKKSRSAYQVAIKNDWFNEITQHMIKPKNKNIIWDEKTCTSEALKYNTRKDFAKKSCGAYNVALKLDILNKICSHMKICGGLMLRCVYVYEFPDNHVYVGLTYNHELRHDQHMKSKKSPVYQYINNTKLIPTHKIISDYVNVYSAMKLENEILQNYVKSGWIKINRAATGGIGWIKLPKSTNCTTVL